MADDGMTIGFTLFATALGSCGIAWGEGGIVGVWLPEVDEAHTRERLLAECTAALEVSPATVIPSPVARTS